MTCRQAGHRVFAVHLGLLKVGGLKEGEIAHWGPGAALGQEALGVIHNGAEGVVIKPAQLRCPAQQLHHGCDDIALQLRPSAAPTRELVIACTHWSRYVAAIRLFCRPAMPQEHMRQGAVPH